jgi:hypothetical protein
MAYAADCKSVYPGSIPGLASTIKGTFTYMSIYNLIFDHYKKFKINEYDESNFFIYDALGFLRWYSPVSDFSFINSDNEEISSFIKTSNKNASVKFKKIYDSKKRQLPLEVNFSLIVSNETLDAFLSKERISNEIILTIEDKINANLQLKRVSSEYISKTETKLTIMSQSGICAELIDEDFKNQLFLEISNIILDKFKINITIQ